MPAQPTPSRGRRRPSWRAGLVALALTAAGLVVPTTAAHAADLPAAGGTYVLRSAASGKCLEVAGGSTASGALLTAASCATGATRQQWRLEAQGTAVRMVNVATGRCVDVPGATSTSGTQLQQWGCAGAQTNQAWTVQASATASGKVRLTSVGTARCVSVKDGSTASGAPVVQETCADVARMQWTPTTVVAPPAATVPVTGAADGFATGTTGGAAGATVTVSTLADLKKYAAATEPYVIQVSGTITVAPFGDMISVGSNKTIVGLGTTGTIANGGLRAVNQKNIIIRNLTIRDTRMTDDDPDDKTYDYDGIRLDTVTNAWIDHNRIVRMNDGLVDLRKDTTNVTLSWNEIGEGNKAIGIGWTTNVTARITMHHNWIHDTNQRNPSMDNAQYAHLYNNWLQNITSYGNLSRGGTKMLLENSYFQNVKNPYYPTDSATLVQRGSVVTGSSGRQETRGTAFEASTFYPYTLDKASDLPALLRAKTGPQGSTVGTGQKATVAADGTGTYTTVQAAIDAAPSNSSTRTVITIAPGTYRGVVTVPSTKTNITLRGLGASPADVRIAYGNSAFTHGTFNSATAFLDGKGVEVENLTIANDFDETTTADGHQAVALHLKADRAVLRNVRLLGDQDTLLVNETARAYVVDSYVEGTVDFVFGGGVAVFHRTTVNSKRSTGGPITAASTPAARQYGFLFYQSTITGAATNATTLGRPWRPDGQVLFRESTLGGTVRTSQPWTDMSGNTWQKARFTEYKNTGPGAGTGTNRPQLAAADAARYTPQAYLAGSDGWNPVG